MQKSRLDAAVAPAETRAFMAAAFEPGQTITFSVCESRPLTLTYSEVCLHGKLQGMLVCVTDLNPACMKADVAQSSLNFLALHVQVANMPEGATTLGQMSRSCGRPAACLSFQKYSHIMCSLCSL